MREDVVPRDYRYIILSFEIELCAFLQLLLGYFSTESGRLVVFL